MSDSRLQNIFVEALDRPTPAERTRFLDDVCGPDVALRQQVESLLKAHEEAGSFFADPAKKPSGLPDDTQVILTEKPGDRIGRYKLLQQIGEGGCGVVYLAEQEEPVRRQVALKVIKLGMDTRQVIARFEAERQALALMDHPHIARVLDAGSTEAGRPYFVMELVRGARITEFCDENKLPTQKRIALFMQVCQAIQHAHQKGVIHRDIKPSNILVTVNDGEPVPKVIDFGIAKATQGRLTNQTLFTALEQFIGTPAYMSPEQAVLTSADVDTRSDIYSLGVLLYELLTGETPFSAADLLAVGFDEMRRTIQEQEPPRPSARLGSMTSDTLTATARARRTEAPRLVHEVSGDLDWIVMKCLEKDRSRRYETAIGLASELGRYLQSEPVLARPPSSWYVLRKLARRHRTAGIVATIVVLALLLALVVLGMSNVRIREEQLQKQAALALAQTNEQEAKAQLFTSLKSQAEARRSSRRPGQRLDSLAALNQAAQIRRDDDLRDAAIAALAVPDLRPGPAWRARGSNDTGIAFDADCLRYAVIDDQSMVTVRTVADHQELRRFPTGPPLRQRSDDRGFLFSPDGRWLAKLEQDQRWSCWETATGRLALRTDRASGSMLAFTRDSNRVAFSVGHSLVLLDLTSGRELKRWPFSYKPRALEFSPDDRLLAVGTTETPTISIFDLEQGQLQSELSPGISTDRALAWHPSGDYLAVAHQQYIQIWDVETATLVTSSSHSQAVTSLSFDPAGAFLISDSWDGTPRLWHASPAREWIRFFSGRNQLRFSANGKWAGVLFPGDGQAQLLEFIPSKAYHTFFGNRLDAEQSFHYGAVSPDGRLLALCCRSVTLRELPSGRELATLPMDYTKAVYFHPSGNELLILGLKGLERWPIRRDPQTPQRLHLGPGTRLPLKFVPNEISFAKDGRTVAVTALSTGAAYVMDFETGAVRDQTFSHREVNYAALSSDARWLATAGWHSTQVQVWNAQTGEKLWELNGDRARVTFTPDGRELVVAKPQAYFFYDVQTQEITRRFARTSSMHFGWIDFSRDGKLMAMEVAPGVIRLCEVATGRTLAHLQDPHGGVSNWLGFTPDGTQLIAMAGYEHSVHRWDLRALRSELKAMNLDWDWPEFAPGTDSGPLPALEVEVVEE